MTAQQIMVDSNGELMVLRVQSESVLQYETMHIYGVTEHGWLEREPTPW